ncbi:MAG: hypothetical protein QI197_05570 [Candidatus Korarchaeota archaeon]|nr:hypothetical protein [Candidatus Korarchaeota archaeon]
MRKPLTIILLISSLFITLIPVNACIPTGGVIGSLYEGKLKLDLIYRAFKDMGLKAVISEERIQGLTLSRVEVMLGDLVGRGRKVLHGYIYQGHKKSLVLTETDEGLSDSPLKLMKLLLVSAGLAELNKFSNPIKSSGNRIPPAALVKWLREEKGVDVKQETLRCISGTVEIWVEERAVAILSNEIDRNLSFGVISRALGEVGLGAVWLDATDPKQVAKVLNYPAVIVLGGPLSPGSGYVSEIYMPKDDAMKLLLRMREGRRGGVISEDELPMDRPLLVIAGVDRNDTRETALAFASSELPSRMKEAVLSLKYERERGLFELRASSSASCGSTTGRDVTVAVGYNDLLILMREGAPDPCYRHVIQWYELDLEDKVLRIVIDLERSSKVCIQCLAVVETRISAGPLPEGEWTVIVDGSSRRVVLGS